MTSDSVLVVIDVQGKLASLMHEHEHLFHNLDRLIKAMQIMNVPIVWTEQVPEKIGETVPQVKDLLFPILKPIIKSSFSCWGEPHFVASLNALNVKNVIVCGIETHVCVYQTARDLKRHGYNVRLIADAVSSRTKENKEIAVERMRDEGMTIASTEMIICELLATAKHPNFKEVMAQIKR